MRRFTFEHGNYIPEVDVDNFPNMVSVKDIKRILRGIHAADVAPVKHGKWIGKQLDNFRKYEVTCSNCGWVGIENYDSYNEPSDFNYCPDCGAKMDLEG